MNLNQVFIPVFLMISFSAWSQDVSELEERFGFKDIRLEAEISDYPQFELSGKKHDTEGVSIYEATRDSYTSIGDIKIFDVTVLAYRGRIFEITVVTKKDSKLYKGLEKAFGKPQITVGYGAYTWKTDKLSLVFRSYSKSKLELKYHSFGFERWLKEEKEEDIEEVSSDF
jgi:hypothetical protein